MSALPAPPLRRVVITAVSTLAGGLALLALKPHGAAGVPPVAAAGPSAGGAASAAPSAGARGGAPAGGATRSGGSATGTRTVDGDTVQTRYGPVQLRITLTAGKITAVTALQLPQDNPRDEEISGFAVPQLTQEALAAQSARIDTVSGATYTSEGYQQSLQSALDRSGG